MSALAPRRFRFATPAQWRACLLEGAARLPSARAPTIRPHALYGGPAARFASPGAAAPAVAELNEILWRDASGKLLRLPADFAQPQATAAPGALVAAPRIVAGSGMLWVAGAAPGEVLCFEAASTVQRLSVDLSPARVLDLAADGRGGLLVLLEANGAWRCLALERNGVSGDAFELTGIGRPRQLAHVRSPARIVVLDDSGTRLHWFVPGRSEPERSVALNWPWPCFEADWLAADARSRVAVAGVERGPEGETARVLVYDGEGRPLEDLVPEARATGLAASRDLLVVTTAEALLRYASGDVVPEEVAEARCSVMTPVMHSPVPEATRRWLRLEASVALGEGATLELACASTDDEKLVEEATRIAQDATLSAGDRLRRLRETLPWRTPVALHGRAASARLDEHSVPRAMPLFDVRERYLWVSATLSAAPGARLPELAALEALYAGPTLMDQLPAIYRRAEAEPGSFIRSLVGVLETTTQSLDARIAGMGDNVDPASAPEKWLDFTARWLGLPWSDALALEQKRALLLRAAPLAAARGTRAGLELMLECLMPAQQGAPPRYRVTDVTADHGLATAGGPGCSGSVLPAVLGGLPRSAMVLDRRAELGRGRLPCGATQADGVERLLGEVRVDVAASAQERAAWAPWLEALLAAMTPVSARLRLRWLSLAAWRRGGRLGEPITLEDRPSPHLGSDAVMGLARLPADAPAALPSSLNSRSRLH